MQGHVGAMPWAMQASAFARSAAQGIVASAAESVSAIQEASGPDLAMPSAKRIICVGHSALDRIYRIEAFPP
jgi:hypothetical protein